MDGMLSQEEIDALTGGNSASASAETDAAGSLSDAERDAVGEIANINMGTAATTLSTLLNNKVTITTPQVSYVTMNELSRQYDRPCVFIHISYIEGIDGNNILIMKEQDVKVIADLMMGGDGSNTDGLHNISAGKPKRLKRFAPPAFCHMRCRARRLCTFISFLITVHKTHMLPGMS